MKSRMFFGVLLALSFLLIFADSAEARKIKRSCSAHYELRFQMLNGKDVTEDEITARFGYFSAERGCGSRVPERCRRRAKNAAHFCMLKHWQNRRLPRIPTDCRKHGVQNYSVRDLENLIEFNAWSELQELRSEAPVRNAAFGVFAVTEGTSPCAKEVELSSRYLWPRQRINLQPPASRSVFSVTGSQSDSSFLFMPSLRMLARRIWNDAFFVLNFPATELETTENLQMAGHTSCL